MLRLPNRILVCPLDWGLGHASRMIPVIYTLLKNNQEVVIAADNLPLQLLRSEFPELTYIRFPSYIVKYSKKKSLVASMLKQAPMLLYQIYKEHNELKKIIKKYKIKTVISDNRYGLWSKSVNSIFVTHQIQIMMPAGLSFFSLPVCLLNRFFIKKYNQCWIPDIAGENNLSGDLSHNIPLPANASFIGILSRFTLQNKFIENKFKTDVLVILSGPEPQRTIFEEIIISQLLKSAYSSVIVTGNPGAESEIPISQKIRKVSHLNSAEMKQAIINSGIVICRSGYTSIMDLTALKKKAILIPTPGQTEQEYLAKYMMQKNWFYCVDQDKFNLPKAIEELKKVNQQISINSENLLIQAISGL